MWIILKNGGVIVFAEILDNFVYRCNEYRPDIENIFFGGRVFVIENVLEAITNIDQQGATQEQERDCLIWNE